MFPVILRDGAKPWIAAGASGGRRIMAAVLQLMSFVADFGMTPEAAAHQPRIDVSGPDKVTADRRLAPDILRALRGRRAGRDRRARRAAAQLRLPESADAARTACAPASATRPRPGRRRWRRREPAHFRRVDRPRSATLALPAGDIRKHRAFRIAAQPQRGRALDASVRENARCRGARSHRDPASVENLWRARRRRHRAERYRLHGRGRRIPLDRRPIRLRQVDAAENPRRADAGDRRAGAAQRHADRRAAQAISASCSSRRCCFPGAACSAMCCCRSTCSSSAARR